MPSGQAAKPATVTTSSATPRPMLAFVYAFGLLSLVAWPRTTAAQRGDFDDAYALKIGVPLGYAVVPDDTSSFFSGVELNFGTGYNREIWFGMYTDAQWRFEAKQTRWTIGPMIGWTLFGVDGGYLVARRDQALQHGLVVRPFATAGIVAAYYRFEILFEERELSHDVGVLLEFPFLFEREHPRTPAE
jgi:hypothetical protein